MGRPFKTELKNIPNTLKRAFSDELPKSLEQLVNSTHSLPLIIVGSGGSLSSAYFIARLHEEVTGRMAKAMTPLDFMLSKLNPVDYGVLFVTASGNNKDILNAFKFALHEEYSTLGVVCASESNKLVHLAESYQPYVNLFKYNCPSGRDGFVAVNSLLSNCVWLARGYRAILGNDESVVNFLKTDITNNNQIFTNILNRSTIVALGGEWSWPALVDLESKFIEVGLKNIHISDIRNFGHGKHNWFHKKGNESALLILETPQLRAIAEKTQKYLPVEYPRLRLATPFTGPLACIDLFTQVFGSVQSSVVAHFANLGILGVILFVCFVILGVLHLIGIRAVIA